MAVIYRWPLTVAERTFGKQASTVSSGSEARIRGNLKRTLGVLGVIDPRTADQKPIADVFALLGERPLRPMTGRFAP